MDSVGGGDLHAARPTGRESESTAWRPNYEATQPFCLAARPRLAARRITGQPDCPVRLIPTRPHLVQVFDPRVAGVIVVDVPGARVDQRCSAQEAPLLRLPDRVVLAAQRR